MKVNEQGRSMIEMLGVLAIIGVLSVGGIMGYSKAMTKYKTNKVIDQVSMIVTNIRTLYAQQNSYSGLINDTAVEMGVIPDEMYGTGSGDDAKYKLRNAFNGSVFITEASSGLGSDDKAFMIAYTGLPKEACVNIATGDWGSGTSAGMIGMRIAGDGDDFADAEITAGEDANNPNVGFADYEELQFQSGTGHEGEFCEGTKAADGEAFACAGGAVQPIPLNVAQAGLACACGTKNACSIVWKYY